MIKDLKSYDTVPPDEVVRVVDRIRLRQQKLTHQLPSSFRDVTFLGTGPHLYQTRFESSVPSKYAST